MGKGMGERRWVCEVGRSGGKWFIVYVMGG